MYQNHKPTQIKPFCVMYAERRCKVFYNITEECHEMKNMDNIMTILHHESNHEKTNKVENIGIL